ncbi:MAG: DNA-3-methyladenine glycosylase [Candidatus Saccharibacteria bacterium]|nr:DNA-3-methyladenine glycosylase [Candidatus Saccharibacteria bacterium]
MLLANDETVTNAAKHLAKHDPVLGAVIERVGICPLRPHKNYYQELVQSIIGQQLSLKSAAAIEARFVALFSGEFPSPEAILAMDEDSLRSVGFSRAKAAYVHDLARHVKDGKILLDTFDRLSNAEVINELTAVKGIGEWTVHMFLIFCMGRMDVLPVGDLGIKNGVRELYNFETLPTAKDIAAIAQKNNWHPYESIASWYVWQSLTLS